MKLNKEKFNELIKDNKPAIFYNFRTGYFLTPFVYWGRDGIYFTSLQYYALGERSHCFYNNELELDGDWIEVKRGMGYFIAVLSFTKPSVLAEKRMFEKAEKEWNAYLEQQKKLLPQDRDNRALIIKSLIQTFER